MPRQQPIHVREGTVSRRPVNHRGDWVFVALTDDAGNVGYGEAPHSTDDAATIALPGGARSEQIRRRAWDDPASASATAWPLADRHSGPRRGARLTAVRGSASGS